MQRAPALRRWLRERLAPYEVPARVRVVHDLPRNAMGKVTKPAVSDLFDPDGDADAGVAAAGSVAG